MDKVALDGRKRQLLALPVEQRTMNAQVRLQWIADLTSGRFKQAQGLLRRLGSDNEGRPGYCCLGVLAKRSGAVLWKMTHSQRQTSVLFADWSGGLSADAQNEFASANDAGATFEQIATLIRDCIVGAAP